MTDEAINFTAYPPLREGEIVEFESPVARGVWLTDIAERDRYGRLRWVAFSAKVGRVCKDGGRCNHYCKEECFRERCCTPLGASGLDENWNYRRGNKR